MVTQRGLSLIELLVVLALLSFLLMLAVPFTNTWGDKAQLQDAEQLLHQGIGRTKALALRNHAGMTHNQVAAVLCLENPSQTLKIYKSTLATQETICSGTLIWSAHIHKKISMTNGGKNFTCLAMNNRGLLIDSNHCSTKSQYTLSIGDESENITFN